MGKTTCTLCGHVNSKAQTNGKVETVRPPIIIDEPKKENQPVRKEPIKRSRPAPVQKAKPDKAQVRQTVKGEKKYASRVMARGRVTIPKQVREMLDVGEGDALIFKVAEGVITVMKVQKDT
jgi:AbrB family looped-hinge helix DNA binding protein